MFLAVSMNDSPLLSDDADGDEVGRVGPEPLGGEAEAGAGPRGRLEEQVDDHLALEVGGFLALALADIDEFLGGVEDGEDLVAP